jgi:sulfatase modifying factor 1
MKFKIFAVIVCVMAAVNFASADIIRGINIDFVTIGNAGNTADTGGTPGCGAVGYNYRIGKYEVANAQWNTFTAAAGAPRGNPSNAYDQNATYTGSQQPVNRVSWYESLQFCNYLTSGDKSKGVYQFSGNNTNPGDFTGINRTAAIATYSTVYVLPTEDEWYKAAYYKPDGSGYSLYANGQNTIPAADNGWNYSGGSYSTVWNVGTGTEEQNGTLDMMGNVWEWNETLVSLDPPGRGVRGGCFLDNNSTLRSSFQYSDYLYDEAGYVGFRIASVPEPATICLFGLAGLMLRRRK